jgi:hypothetical protein
MWGSGDKHRKRSNAQHGTSFTLVVHVLHMVVRTLQAAPKFTQKSDRCASDVDRAASSHSA